MKKPVRIQLSRTRGYRLQDVSKAINGLPAAKVDRSTKWGNPWKLQRIDGCWCVDDPPFYQRGPYVGQGVTRRWNDSKKVALRYSIMMHGLWRKSQLRIDDLESLRGKNLACWCKPGDHCHADILLELAND